MKEGKKSFDALSEKLKSFEPSLPLGSWEAMDAILDGKASVPQPVVPKRKRYRWGILFLLLGVGMVASAGLAKVSDWNLHSLKQDLHSFPIPHTEVVAENKISEETVGTNPILSISDEVSVETEETVRLEHTKKAIVSQSGLDTKENNQKAESSLIINEPTKINEENIEPTEAPLQTVVTPIATLEKLPVKTTVLDASEAYSLTSKKIIVAKKLPKWFAGISGGIDAHPRQINGVGGLFFGYHLHDKWSAQLGIRYKQRSETRGNGLAMKALAKQTIYFARFSALAHYQDSIHHLHFIEVPLTLSYHASPRWSLFAGGQFVAVRNQSQWKERITDDGTTGTIYLGELINTKEQTSPGIVKFDAGLIFGATYQLNPQFAISAEYIQGLYDLTYDNYFNRSGDDLNSSLQVSLKWFLKKR